MNKIIVLISFLIPLFVCAAEYMPYSEANISNDEWLSYYQEVKGSFSDTEKIYPDYNLVTYSDNQTRMSFAFTTEGHPAHPSWITRQVVESNDTIDMQQIGYFAGEEEAFAILFRQYAKITEETRKQFRNNAN